jgi:hypothetical protein
MEENVETKPKVSIDVRQLNDETEEIIASKVSQFGKGFKIPDDRKKKKKNKRQHNN